MREVAGVRIFNATPHSLTFEVGERTEIVLPDEIITAHPVEISVPGGPPGVQLVQTKFEGTPEGEEVIRGAKAAGADIIVGSIIAAQAFPGAVVAMIPVPGFERVPPDQKRMRPDKFTVF